MTMSLMAQEAAQTPQLVAQQLKANAVLCQELRDKIAAHNPSFVYIVGRGSSDHAGVFAKYLIEVEMGLPVTASAPSVRSVYGKKLALDKALVLVISQSGRSPDILTQTQQAREQGALCVALVNDESSPLAELVDVVLPLGAGEERAVAATKSYLCTLSAILQLVAYWKQDETLLSALNELPEQLSRTIDSPVQLQANFVQPLAHCVVLGRGFGYAISREIALKMKEVCGVHAEAFSSAEFLHGPVTLVEKRLAVVDIKIEDESAKVHQQQIEEVAGRGANVAHMTQLNEALHPRLAPLTLLQRFYLDIESISQAMGLDPDNPIGLKKVTRTV